MEVQTPHVGAMLAHFSLLGVFFALLAVSCAFVGRFLLMLIVFFPFGVAPGLILERPGSIVDGPKPHFSMVCRPCRLAVRTNCACAKTIVFARFLYGFYTSQALCSSDETAQNRSRSLSTRDSCKDFAKNASWDGFWEGLAPSWVPLGQLLFALGRLLASLGHFLGVSWALLGRSWLSLGCSVELHGCISVPRTVPGLDFKGFGDVSD